MSQSQSALRFDDYKNLAHWITVRVRARAARAKLNLDYDDVFQEVALIWTRCRDLYRPETGVKFSTYFANSGLRSYRRVCQSILGHPEELNYEDFSHPGSEDEGAHFLDYTADPKAENPELQVMRMEEVKRMLGPANPLLLRLVRLCADAPPELMEQLKAAKAQYDFAKQMGVAPGESPPVALTPQVVGKIMRFNWRKRKELNLDGALR